MEIRDEDRQEYRALLARQKCILEAQLLETKKRIEEFDNNY